MRSRRPSPEHEQAVARRLAALSAEWEAARVEGGDDRPSHDRASDASVGLPAESGHPDDPDWESQTRVRGALLVPVEDPAPEGVPEEPAALVQDRTPVPGRHAARRPTVVAGVRTVGRGPAGRLLEHVGLRVTHLVWVAAFAMAALAVTSWWLVRAKESAVVTPVAAPAAETPGPAAAATDRPGVPPGAPAPSTAAEVVVDVTGKVRRPGLVVLPVGSRVADALEAAGGARRGVDLQPLNLARVLVDGEQIVVGGPAGPPAPGSTGAAAPPAATPGGLVNLNTATQAELEELPGVGPVTAGAIIEWRTRHGGFASVEDLLEVSGIGEVTLERLAPLVTV